MKLVTASMMQAFDMAASASLGPTTLMQRAGRAIAALVRILTPPGTIVAIAGSGNNGGDAFAACAELQPEYSCIVYSADPSRPSESRQDAVSRAQAAGVHIAPLPRTFEEAANALVGAALILDGILGVGAKFPIVQTQDSSRPDFAHLIKAINSARAPVLALDLPTGIDATDGSIATEHTVRADYTLMLGLPKYGACLSAARAYCGALWFSDLGLGDWESISPKIEKLDHAPYGLMTAHEAEALLPQRPFSAEKRSAGAPLILAGSEDFPGAAILCARGAARMGAGYVTVGTPSNVANILRHHLIEQVIFSFDETDVPTAIATILKKSANAGSLAIGPGMALNDATGEIIRGVIEETTLPLVIDASALRHLHGHLEMLRNRSCVITPHAGEFAALSDLRPFEESERLERLQHFVQTYGITTLLKGNATLIADPTTLHLNPTGTNVLATAGTGDVLTGMIATLLAQGLSPLDAACLAAYLHGLAGQYAQRHCQRGVMAGDLPDHLRFVWDGLAQELLRQSTSSIRLMRLDALTGF